MIFVHTSIFLGLTSEVTTTFLQTTSDSCPVQTNSLALLGGLFEMGYFGVGLLFGQDADSIAPPTKSRNAPAQAMNTAAPNSYLQKGEGKKSVKIKYFLTNSSILQRDRLEDYMYKLHLQFVSAHSQELTLY